jgi:hypothetical protein
MVNRIITKIENHYDKMQGLAAKLKPNNVEQSTALQDLTISLADIKNTIILLKTRF